MNEIDLAAIMATHQIDLRFKVVEFCVTCPSDEWPCLPYRLAEALMAAQERERRVVAVLNDWDSTTSMDNAWPEHWYDDLRAALASVQDSDNLTANVQNAFDRRNR